MARKTNLFFMFLMGMLLAISSCKKKNASKDATINDYTGTWSVTGSCSAYTMSVTASGSTLTFSKLKNCFTITATVSGNTLTIPSQTVSAATSSCGYPYTISGSGTLSGDNFNKLELTYSTKDISGATSNCSSTCTK